MKKQIRYTTIPILFLLVSGISPSGQATNDQGLGKMLPVAIEKIEDIVPYGVQAKHTKDGLLVSGRANHRHHRHLIIRGHMEVELLDADGVVLARNKAYMSRHKQLSRHRRNAPFSTLFKNVPAETHKVRILSHAGMGHH